MKSIFLTALFALSSVSHAVAEKVEFKCVSGFPTTSFFVKTEGKDVLVRVIHHNGTKYAPIHEGIVVPNDIDLIKSRAELLAKLGEDFTFRFPLEECSANSPGQMVCFAGDTKVFEGQEFTATMLSLYTSTANLSGNEIESQWVTLYFDTKEHIPGPYVTMRYSPIECDFQGPM